MTINFKSPEIKELQPRLLVVGVGGAGGNALNEMIDNGLQGVEFIAVNTDAQDLKLSKAKARIQIGLSLTKGLGAGAKHDIGQAAADESLNEIVNTLQGANMVFITAGMGGGTGTGAAHVIARAAKELNILTVGVVTLPFLYEGPSRMRRAQVGLEELRKHVDTIIVIPNQNLFKVANEQTTFEESFNLSNNVLMQGVQSVTDLMVRPGIVNLDFADVETVMASMGKAMMGTGEAEGEGRAAKAADMAISNPLIDDYTLKGAKGLLVNITGGKDLKLFEVDEVVNKIRAEVDPEAEVIIGAITSGDLDGKIRVSIVATALDGQQPESKSVINMVHRIQNRNPGYSDFNSASSAQSFNFSPTMTSPISHGANALKLENEIIAEPVTNTTSSEMMNEQTVSNQEVESIVENNQSNDYEQSFSEEALTTAKPEENSPMEEEHVSNGLENFGVEGEDAPDLFSSDSATSETEGFLSTETSENTSEDDDLEIPAFLRRQKN
ncbi:cell division protein FtsZ [Candidatus Pelagibacter ubique]|jgi:cell division protein FtsZ|uniref:Cell division protein FtsZ n=1 Tax=Pelagibacter ubique (strain HTCC1062) TaxID=335992 RepID=Q4FPN4_PELUB|nr:MULTISPECIES: cell division protein FtsZ [Pelagibacter]MDB4231238.1 cell division protein FtsZ [Candidatus Pelagibacter sp.]AAZ20857.1 cell division protein FtsZ [Candidatus Pelagibacter ubique HTCC1062]MDA7444918.1 cell division protein FtsZ [Candidatus Pelagibacter ubique]MDA7453734.1 cell division protein FtsZ [Candidatus Pelagibacter ubique]MDA7457351.1 cell division protein FtsZ [Candidatus Pelagibacter ubique]